MLVPSAAQLFCMLAVDLNQHLQKILDDSIFGCPDWKTLWASRTVLRSATVKHSKLSQYVLSLNRDIIYLPEGGVGYVPISFTTKTTLHLFQRLEHRTGVFHPTVL